jgi:hydroxyacylglutathione hydrolase
METPGHTEEHIVYYAETANTTPILFCGDTLFAAGCGSIMGGRAEQLHHSLQRLAALPDNTQVYCAHEYTLSNLQFAQAVEPSNTLIDERIATTIHTRKNNKPTVPFELRQEKQSNPFLRVAVPTVQSSVKHHWKKTDTLSEVDIFTLLRRWKDKG